MSNFHKAVLILEVCLFFIIPSVALLIAFAVIAPFFFKFFSEGYFGSVNILLLFVGGCCGLAGVIMLLGKALGEDKGILKPIWLWGFIFAGASALAPIAMRTLSDPWFWKIVWFSPYLVTAHLLYANRRYMFGY